MAKTFKSQMVKVRNSTTKEFESLLTFKGDKGDKHYILSQKKSKVSW